MRLALLYGGMFLMTGLAVVLITYVLAAQDLRSTGAALPISGGNDLRIVSSGSCPEVRQAHTFDEFKSMQSTCLNHQRTEALHSLLRRSLLCLFTLTLLAFALGYVLAGRVLSPVGRIARMARSAADSHLPGYAERDGHEDEFKERTGAFDELLEQLGGTSHARRRFVANASHELRTPLAINRTLVEVHLSDPGAPVELQQLGRTLLAATERSEKIVEGLILLGRCTHGIRERTSVDLAEAAAQAIGQARAEAGAAGVELRGVRRPAHLQGDGVLLERVALDLVQNAVRHNIPEGGWVDVSTSVQSGHVVLTVSNTGPVVPRYEVDGLFEPFGRPGTQRTNSSKGVGLGLSIVRAATRAHGGTVTATPREDGGLQVQVRLPVRQHRGLEGRDARAH